MDNSQDLEVFRKWWLNEIKILEFDSLGDKIFAEILAKKAFLAGVECKIKKVKDVR